MRGRLASPLPLQLLLTALLVVPYAQEGRAQEGRAQEGRVQVRAGLPLAWQEVRTSLEQHHPAVEAGRQDVLKALAGVLAAEGAFDAKWKARATNSWGNYPYQRLDTWLEQPTTLWGTSLYGGYRVGLGSFALYDGKLETRELGEVRAGISVPLWKNGAIDRARADLQQSALEREGMEARLDEKRLQLLAEGTLRYWEWVAAGQELGIAKALWGVAAERDRQLGERVARGDAAAMEQTDNLRTLYERQAKVVAAERKLAASAIKLSLYYRDNAGAPVVAPDERLPPALPDPPEREPPLAAREAEREALALALEQRPDLQGLRALLRQAEVEQALADNQVAPQLDVSLGVARDVGPGKESLGQTDVEAGVWLEMPLWLRSARGKQASADAVRRKRDAELRYALDVALAELRDARVALLKARERVRLADDQVRAAQQVEEAERLRFDLGDVGILQVNLREQATAEAQRQSLGARLDYIAARTQWEAATGSLLRSASGT